MKITLLSKPPIWAVSLYLLRTEGQVYADYVQMAVSNVEYVINYRETANVDGVLEPDPVTTLYANKDANEIYLDLVTSFQQYKDRNSSSKKGWTFEQGDRLRFIYNPDGDLYDFIEVEIKEQRGNYFVIDNIDSLPELKQGFTVGIRAESEQVRHAGNAAMAHGRQLPVFSRNASAVFLGLLEHGTVERKRCFCQSARAEYPLRQESQ